MLMLTLGATDAFAPDRRTASTSTVGPPGIFPPPPSLKKLLTTWGANAEVRTTGVQVQPVITQPNTPTFPPPLTTNPGSTPTYPQPTLSPNPPTTSNGSATSAGGLAPMSPSDQVYPSGSPADAIVTPPDGMLPVSALYSIPKWAKWGAVVTVAGIGLGWLLSR